MQDYKNNKILELKKEMVKVPAQTDYEINGIDTSRALFFYRKEKEKFKVIPRGSYTITEVASNKYLRITDSSLLSEALEFQICYLFVKSSSSYVDPFPELERLQEHYNELYSDFDNLLQQLQSNNIVGDTMKMAYVLPQLDEGQVWVLRQGEMKAEAIFDLDARLQEAFESFTRVFDNWIQTQKKPEFTQFVDSEKNRVLQAINQKETQSIENIDSHTTNKIAEIEAEGLAQKNLVTGEGTKQVQRVIEAGNNQVANVENAGETEYNKIIATGIDAKQDKIDNRLTTKSKNVVEAINEVNNEKVSKTGDTMTGNLEIGKGKIIHNATYGKAVFVTDKAGSNAFGIGANGVGPQSVRYGACRSDNGEWLEKQLDTDYTHSFDGRIYQKEGTALVLDKKMFQTQSQLLLDTNVGSLIRNNWKEFTLTNNISNYAFLIFVHADGYTTLDFDTKQTMIPVGDFSERYNVAIEDANFNICVGFKKGTSDNKIQIYKYQPIEDDPQNKIQVYGAGRL